MLDAKDVWRLATHVFILPRQNQQIASLWLWFQGTSILVGNSGVGKACLLNKLGQADAAESKESRKKKRNHAEINASRVAIFFACWKLKKKLEKLESKPLAAQVAIQD